MILHTIKTSPLSDHALSECLDYISPPCGLLLMQDAVYAATQGNPWHVQLGKLDNVELYVLADDLIARGLAQKLSVPFEAVDYARFVDLCLDYDTVQSW